MAKVSNIICYISSHFFMITSIFFDKNSNCLFEFLLISCNFWKIFQIGYLKNFCSLEIFVVNFQTWHFRPKISIMEILVKNKKWTKMSILAKNRKKWNFWDK